MTEFLYHGTSASALPRILRHGLRPRKPGQIGNYAKAMSGAGRIYLSDSYALHYAGVARRGSAPVMVLKIPMARLDASRLIPDEDWLAMDWAKRNNSGRKLDQMSPRSALRFCRDHIAPSRPDLAMDSLDRLGVVAYRGAIPADAIEDIAIVSTQAYMNLIIAGYDPVISVPGRSLLGEYYRGWMDWLFDETASPHPMETPIGPMTYPGMEARVGIEIVAGPRVFAG